jgi:hypothetical protein
VTPFLELSKDQNSLLRKFSNDRGALNSPRTDGQSITEFLPPLLGLQLYRVFATRVTNHSIFQPPIHEMPSCQNYRSHYLATSLLARSINSYVSSRCPTPKCQYQNFRYETPITPSPATLPTPVDDTVHAIVGTSRITISRLLLRRVGVSTHELSICRSMSRTNGPRDPNQQPCSS